jgi:hypothetical protein
MMTLMDQSDEHPAPPPPDDLDAVSEAASGPPRTTRPRRRRLNVIVIAIVLAVVVAGALGVMYGRVHAKRAALLRAQQACLDYVPPAGQVVYDEEPARAKALMARGGEYVSIPSGDGPAVAGHIPTIWREMRRWVLPKQPEPVGAVLFLHERKTNVGAMQVLVCVEADRAARKLRVTLVHPGASTLDPAAVTDLDLVPPPQPDLVILKTGGDPFGAKLPDDPNARADLRFLAGQIDTSDPTRFSLPYEFNGQPGEFDCWLDDERVVSFVDRRFEKK